MCDHIESTDIFMEWTPAYKVILRLDEPVFSIQSYNGHNVLKPKKGLLQEFTGPYSFTHIEYNKEMKAKAESFGIWSAVKGRSDEIGFCVFENRNTAKDYLATVNRQFIEEPSSEHGRGFPPHTFHMRKVEVRGEVHTGYLNRREMWMAEYIRFVEVKNV